MKIVLDSRLNVRMTHKALQDGQRRSARGVPCPEAMPQCVRAEVAKAQLPASFLESAHHRPPAGLLAGLCAGDIWTALSLTEGLKVSHREIGGAIEISLAPLVAFTEDIPDAAGPIQGGARGVDRLRNPRAGAEKQNDLPADVSAFDVMDDPCNLLARRQSTLFGLRNVERLDASGRILGQLSCANAPREKRGYCRDLPVNSPARDFPGALPSVSFQNRRRKVGEMENILHHGPDAEGLEDASHAVISRGCPFGTIVNQEIANCDVKFRRSRCHAGANAVGPLLAPSLVFAGGTAVLERPGATNGLALVAALGWCDMPGDTPQSGTFDFPQAGHAGSICGEQPRSQTKNLRTDLRTESEPNRGD